MNSARGLSLFDLDNTLLGGDSDYAWAQFLIERGILDGNIYERENERFYSDYKAGSLDIYAFLDFQLKPLAANSMSELVAWREEFLQKKIVPMLLPAAARVVDERRQAGDLLAVVTATNDFVTRPIAGFYGISNLVATKLEIIDKRFTGRIIGSPCFQAGKLTRLAEWLGQEGLKLTDFAETRFYSDSLNDFPLLEAVTHPVAVDPDPQLNARALERGWPIVSWREAGPGT